MFARLPDREVLALYLRGRGYFRAKIEAALPEIKTPLTLTKRGMLVVGVMTQDRDHLCIYPASGQVGSR